jgi:hypothetical protein
VETPFELQASELYLNVTMQGDWEKVWGFVGRDYRLDEWVLLQEMIGFT